MAEELSRRGLDASGLKAVLVARLEEAVESKEEAGAKEEEGGAGSAGGGGGGAGSTEVRVPQGKVVDNPRLKGQQFQSLSNFGQSEYLVYNEAQCRIRYVLKLHFDQPGGWWH